MSKPTSKRELNKKLADQNIKKMNGYQEDFIFSESKFTCMKASIGTGKTLCLILRAVMLSEMYPKNKGIIIRKEFSDLRDSTISDFEKYTGMKVSKAEKKAVFPNGSEILFRHGSLTDINVLKNINLGWFAIEQAEEYNSAEIFDWLRDRLRREGCAFRPGFIISNANGLNWIYNIFKKNPRKGYKIIEADTYDNAHNLPEEFIADLKQMETDAPSHYNRYVLNSDEELELEDVLIPMADIVKAASQNFNEPTGRFIISADIARSDSNTADETVIVGLEEHSGGRWKQVFLDAYKGAQTDQTAGRLLEYYKDHNPDFIVVDDGNMGAGVVDLLKSAGIRVYPFISQQKSFQPNYKNLKAQCFYALKKLFANGRIQIMDDDETKYQLSYIRFVETPTGERIIMSKKMLKSQGFKSHDRADPLMMAMVALDSQMLFRSSHKFQYKRKKLNNIAMSYA